MKKEEARRIEGIVNGLLRNLQTKKVKKASAVKDAWEAATKKETKEHAHIVNYKKGVITVIVENSSWLYKLTLEKRNILEKFNQNYRGRKKAGDIRFRVG